MVNKAIYVTLILLIAACSNKQDQSIERISYVCPLDTTFNVAFNHLEQTATLYDQADRIFILKRVPDTQNNLYQNNQGVSVHRKNNTAIIELVKNRPIVCRVWEN